MSCMLIRAMVFALLCFQLVACSKADEIRPASAQESQPPQQLPHGAAQPVGDPLDWEALFLQMQEADRIDDDVERCLKYPDVPGMTWDPSLVRARCALVRKPRYGIADITRQVETTRGRAALERHFDALLQAHYDQPGERDQIAFAFNVFDERLDAREASANWHARSPDSAYARFAYGMTLLSTAQAARGESTASSTPADDLRKARELAAEAARQLALAYEAEPRLTPACAARVDAARLGATDEDPFEIGKRCVRGDPLSYRAVMAWKSAAEPRWGGSQAQLQEVERHVIEHRIANPLMDSLRAAIEADASGVAGPRGDDSAIEALEHAARIGPNSTLLNLLSASWYARGDRRRGLAYLSQAVRFSIGLPRYRAFRVQMNLFTRPEWAIVDLEYSVRRDPGAPYDRQLLAQAKDNLRNGTAEKMARDGFVTLDDGGADRKATYLKECEEYGLAGKQSSDVMNDCSDTLVREWPEDPEAWRVRADVLYLRGDPRALEAASKYLEIAKKDAPAYETRAARYAGWLKRVD